MCLWKVADQLCNADGLQLGASGIFISMWRIEGYEENALRCVRQMPKSQSSSGLAMSVIDSIHHLKTPSFHVVAASNSSHLLLYPLPLRLP